MAFINNARGYMNGTKPYGKRSRCYNIPYLMLQIRVENNTEVKLVFFNKKFCHCANLPKTAKSLPSYSTEAIVQFCYEVLESLVPFEDIFILDGLVRIDVFESDDGKLMVNELESLEADFVSSDISEVINVENMMKQYWKDKIFESMIHFLSDSP